MCTGYHLPGPDDPEYVPRRIEPDLPCFSSIDLITGTRVHLITFGCTYNHGDTGKIAAVLKEQGCVIFSSPSPADAVVVNTCTVVASTERRVIRTIRALTGVRVYVTGCMAVVQPETILEACHSAVLIHPWAIQEAYRAHGLVGAWGSHIVQLASGCTGSCRYCITKKARGEITSVPRNEVVREVVAISGAGHMEVQLSAQDLSAWGIDLGASLGELLEDIASLPGDFTMRLGMMNPRTLIPSIDEVIRALSHPRFFSFLHIPIQSGSDYVINAMGRGYTMGEIRELLTRIRSIVSAVTIATDIIVGFPGETDQDFSMTVFALRELRFSKVNITRYS
jgi:tRNA A37 methylthiotransferase MiaB